MKAEGFLLDLDNTIYDYESAHAPALQAAVQFLATEIGELAETISAHYQSARKRVHEQLHGQAASHSRLLYFQYALEQLGIKPYELAVRTESFYWDIFFQNMQLRPDCESFLKMLAPRPVVIITDLTSGLQLRKVTHLKLQKYISAVVTSEEAGCEKPDAKIFSLAIAKSGLKAAKLCMIGDSWEKDIVGALQFGMPCYWLQKANESQAQIAGSSDVVGFQSFSELIEQVQINV